MLKSGTTSSCSEPNGCLVLDTQNRYAYQPSSATRKPAQLSSSDADDEYFIPRSTNEQEDDCDGMCPTNPPNSPTVLSLNKDFLRRYPHYKARISPQLDLDEDGSLPYTGYARKDGMLSVKTITMCYFPVLDPGCDSARAPDRVDMPEADSELSCWGYAADKAVSLGMAVAEVTAAPSLDVAARAA